MRSPNYKITHSKNRFTITLKPFRENYSEYRRITFRNRAIGILNEDLFVSEVLVHGNRFTIHRYSLIKRCFIKSYHVQCDDIKILLNCYREIILENDPNDPDKIFLYFINMDTNELCRCILNTGKIENLHVRVITPYVIDRENRYIYHYEQQKKSPEPVTLFFRTNLETLEQEEFYISREDHFIGLLNFDPERRVLLFGSYNSTDEFKERKLSLLSVDGQLKKIEHDLCFWFFADASVCVRDGILKLDNDNSMILFNHFRKDILTINVNCLSPLIFFNWTTGHLISTDHKKIVVLDPDAKFSSSPNWSIRQHRYTSVKIKMIVKIFLILRNICQTSTIFLLPNELLFEIFHYL